mgnify:CR=1 FL=1
MLSTDAVARRLTADGDLDISAGRSTFVAGVEGVAQGVAARLALIRGEFEWDRTAGFSLYENDHVAPRAAIMGQAFNEAKLWSAFLLAVLSTPAVVAVPKLEITWSARTRKAAVTYVARTLFGDTPPTTVEI